MLTPAPQKYLARDTVRALLQRQPVGQTVTVHVHPSGAVSVSGMDGQDGKDVFTARQWQDAVAAALSAPAEDGP